MRILIFFVIIILDICASATLLQNISILSVLPNTTLILIISYSLLRGEYEGSIFGFIAGFIFDLFLSNYIGFFTLLGTVVGYVASKPFTNLYRESYVPPVITTFVVATLFELLFYLINVYVYGYVSIFTYTYTVIVPIVLYSTVVTPIIFKFISIINSYIEGHEGHKRKMF